MKPIQLLGFALVLGTGACASDVPDELAGEDASDDAGKEDGDGAFTYWRVELGDASRVTRANRSVTECGNGVRGASCDAAIDLAGTAMPASVAKGFQDRLAAGEPLLLRGELQAARPEVAFAELSRTAGAAIAAADLAPATQGSPSIHVGDENGPDCLYGRLFIHDVDVAGAQITVTPTTVAGSLAFEARFDGVSIPSSTEHAVACVNGTSTVTINAKTLTAVGTLTVAADGKIAFANMTYQFSGVTHDSPKPPPDPVFSMLLDNDDAIGNIVTSSVALTLAPMVAQAQHARALVATEVWVPGSAEASDLSGVFVLATQEADGVLERRLNSTRFANIDEVDLAASGATGDAIDRATAELPGDGVLLVGYRYIDGGKHGRAANQFWTKAPVPLH